MRRLLTAAVPLAVAAIAGCGLGGCASPNLNASGFEVDNSTGQIVRVELLRLDRQGEMHPYAVQTLSPGGHYVHKVDDEEFQRGLRARFTLAGQTPEEGNWVMLQIGRDTRRRYDLQLVNGRLSARDTEKRAKPREWGPADE